jgi:nitronate monooxygenase
MMARWHHSALTELLGTDHPIVQAPMASVTTPSLAAAVSEAGGLGSLGCANLGLEDLRAQIRAVRAVTSRPFNVNFFCHVEPVGDIEREGRMRERLEPFYRELGLEQPESVQAQRRSFYAAQLEILLDERPPVVSFHFGLPAQEHIQALKEAGAAVMCSATTVEEAAWLEARGVDAIIAQGYEAGGHRGTFLTPFAAAQIGTLALVPQIRSAVRRPVVAAGGIMDGRGIAAAFMLGASGVQLGTAFLLCPESATSVPYRRALQSPAARHTRVTRAFSGRPARAIVNRLAEGLADAEEEALAFPLQLALTRPLQQAGAGGDSADFLAMWAGQGAPLARVMPAGDLVSLLVHETEAVFRGAPVIGRP